MEVIRPEDKYFSMILVLFPVGLLFLKIGLCIFDILVVNSFLQDLVYGKLSNIGHAVK